MKGLQLMKGTLFGKGVLVVSKELTADQAGFFTSLPKLFAAIQLISYFF